MLDLVLVYNTGAAFSILSTAGGWQRWAVHRARPRPSVRSSSTGCATFPRNARWTPLALSLLLGGAVGNVIDRVRVGAVVDFIDFQCGRLALARLQYGRLRHLRRCGPARPGHVFDARRHDGAGGRPRSGLSSCTRAQAPSLRDEAAGRRERAAIPLPPGGVDGNGDSGMTGAYTPGRIVSRGGTGGRRWRARRADTENASRRRGGPSPRIRNHPDGPAESMSPRFCSPRRSTYAPRNLAADAGRARYIGVQGDGVQHAWTLRPQGTRARALRSTPDKVLYDSNTTNHNHIYDVDTGALTDIEPGRGRGRRVAGPSTRNARGKASRSSSGSAAGRAAPDGARSGARGILYTPRPLPCRCSSVGRATDS